MTIAWKVVGRKVDKENWLKDLYATAQKSVGIPVQSHSKAMEMFRLILMDFAQLCQRRSEIEHNAEEYLKENDDYRRLRTLPGVGPIIALVILSESGNLRRFAHWRQYIKFCGFDLCTHQSGQFRGKTKLSKRGNNHLRQAFWMASAIAIRMRENTFRRKFENYIKEDPTNADLKRKAYTAVAAKMAKVAHSLIKNETDYLCTHRGT